MMIFIGILIAIFLFSFIIFIHELGHFLAARFFGMKVVEFGIGIPPKAKKIFTDKHGTDFTLNWLPIGGFVRLENESNHPYYAQIIVLLAGVFMNFLLAILIFTGLFYTGVSPIGINTKIETNQQVKLLPTYNQALSSGFLEQKPGVLIQPTKNSLAEKGGIQAGDILIKINNQDISNINDFQNILKTQANQKITLSLLCSQCENKNNPYIVHIQLDQTAKIGAYIGDNISINHDFEYKYNLFDSFTYAISETYAQSILTLKGLKVLLGKIILPESPQEQKEAIQQVSGPIGLVDFIAKSFQAGIVFLCIITAIISISLGVFNLLPIPALDGGRCVLLTLQKIVVRFLGEKQAIFYIEIIINITFFVLLVALSIIIAYNDIYKIISQ